MILAVDRPAILGLGLLALTALPVLASVPLGKEPVDKTSVEKAHRIVFESAPDTPDLLEVRVTGLWTVGAADLSHGEMRRALRVVATEPSFNGDLGELPALLGIYSWHGDETGGELRFRPRFPPAPGLVLRVRFVGAEWDRLTGLRDIATGDAEARFQVPDLVLKPRSRVVAVYPGSAVPSNLLRLYVHFSHPMAARGVPSHVRLLDGDGQDVETAFVDIPDGLWDPERRRLTLLVHPGRVKRGVGPNQVLGPVLRPGETYRLRIEATASDADGAPLLRSFEHELRVGPPDHEPPDPFSWRLEAPSSPTAPLVVDLDEVVDRALLQRLPTVIDGAGDSIPGQSRVSADGRTWTFHPASPWKPGSYRLVVPPELEDPSGNRPGRRFEAAAEDAAELPAIALSFAVKAGV